MGRKSKTLSLAAITSAVILTGCATSSKSHEEGLQHSRDKIQLSPGERAAGEYIGNSFWDKFEKHYREAWKTSNNNFPE